MKCRILMITVTLILTLGLLTACDPNSTPNQTEETKTDGVDIDWTMYGTYLNTEGTLNKPVDLLLKGVITNRDIRADSLELYLSFSDGFDYEIFRDSGVFSSHNQAAGQLPHLYVVQTLSYKKSSHSSVMCYFALSEEKEYFIATFEDAPSRFFVASTNPGTDPQELLDYFADFIEAYSFKN